MKSGSLAYFQKTFVQRFLGDIQNFRVVNAAIIKHLLDDEPEGEGRDIQHVQQSGFTGAHFVSSFDQLHVTLKKGEKGGKDQKKTAQFRQATSS